jgi:hypothetical protein
VSKHKIRLPGFGDSVALAAGEDAHTGTKKLDELLERIHSGKEERLLTRQETGSLLDVRKFKRKRGQHKSDRRLWQSVLAQQLLTWLRALREQLKHDPDEKAHKRAIRDTSGAYLLNERTAERAHQLLQDRELKLRQEYGDDYVEQPVPSVEALTHRLMRG